MHIIIRFICFSGTQVDTDHMSILDALERADQILGNNIMYKRIVVFAGGYVC